MAQSSSQLIDIKMCLQLPHHHKCMQLEQAISINAEDLGIIVLSAVHASVISQVAYLHTFWWEFLSYRQSRAEKCPHKCAQACTKSTLAQSFIGLNITMTLCVNRKHIVLTVHTSEGRIIANVLQEQQTIHYFVSSRKFLCITTGHIKEK